MLALLGECSYKAGVFCSGIQCFRQNMQAMIVHDTLLWRAKHCGMLKDVSNALYRAMRKGISPGAQKVCYALLTEKEPIDA